MSNETKCRNSGCGAWLDNKEWYPTNCYFDKAEDCPKFTTTPTTSIPTAELAELKKDYGTVSHNIQWLNEEYKKLEAENSELRADREMLDWLLDYIGIYWDGSMDDREAITKAMKEAT